LQRDMGLWFNLCSLTNGTAIHIFLHKLGDSRPPVIARNKVISFPSSGVASSYRIVVHFYDIPSEFKVVGDLDVTSIENDSIFVVPVFETF